MCCAASCAAPCAMRNLLGANDPLMWRLVPALVREMGAAYPELMRAESLIAETLKLEETRFRDTLARGLQFSTKRRATCAPAHKLAGEVAFKLYDTYRLSARPDAGRAARARHRRRHRRLQRRHGEPARRSAQSLGRFGRSGDRNAVVRAPRARRRRPNFSATTPRGRRHRRRASCSDGARVDSARKPAKRAWSSSTRRRSMPNPAARSATPAPCARRAPEVRVDRHGEEARRSASCMRSTSSEATFAVGDASISRSTCERRARDPRQSFRHPSAA